MAVGILYVSELPYVQGSATVFIGSRWIRLHWTDAPYIWHINDGEEVFAVLDGVVEMFYKETGLEKSTMLDTGDIFYACLGTEHVAHPKGEARILVIELEGSV